MRPTTNRTLMAAALAGSLLIGSGCGDSKEQDAAKAVAEAIEEAGINPADVDPSALEEKLGDLAGGDIDLGDIELPEGLPISDECSAVYGKYLTALGGITTGQDVEGMEAAVAALESSVPDDLKDDVAILARAFGEFSEVLAKYGDIASAMADPAAAAAIERIGTPEVNAAGEAVGDFFNETCAKVGG